MNKLARWTCVLTGFGVLAASAAACVPGGHDADINNGDPLGRLCTATLSLSGSFVVSTPQPVDVVGCWPVGTWTFSPTLEDNSCPNPPVMEHEYAFQVMRDDDGNETYAFLTDPQWERVNMKVTSGGSGYCEGNLEIFSTDGKVVLNMVPALQADKTISGFGEYDIYTKSQW